MLAAAPPPSALRACPPRAGVVDWRPHLPQLFTHMLAAFKVPVGTATAGCPSALGAPHRAMQLFGSKVDQVDDTPKDRKSVV